MTAPRKPAGTLAVATLSVRFLGFLRNVALAAALGTAVVADAYNSANSIPTMVFLLVGGGTIAAVFVPTLVRLAPHGTERHDSYASALLLLSVAFAVVLTAALLALSPLFVAYVAGGRTNAAQGALAQAWLFWCVPQLLFLAASTTQSQILNAKGAFKAAAWAPSTSSVLIIASCLVIAFVVPDAADPSSSARATTVTILGASTLAGSAAQSLWLFASLRATGFHFRWPRTLKGLGLRSAARTGSQAVAAAACFQLANLVTVAFSSSTRSDSPAGSHVPGYTTLLYAQTLQQTAQAVLVAGVATVLLQRLSRSSSDADFASANRSLNLTLTHSLRLLIPTACAMAALGPDVTRVLFGLGDTTRAEATSIGLTLAVLAVGLIPHSLHALLIRPFYAVGDARGPLLSGLLICAAWIALSVIVTSLVPPSQRVLWLAAAFAMAYWLELPHKIWRLHRRTLFRVQVAVLSVAMWGLAVGAGTIAVVTVLGQQLRGHMDDVPLLALLSAVFILTYTLGTWSTPATLKRSVAWLRKGVDLER